jgi:O-antigen ligase
VRLFPIAVVTLLAWGALAFGAEYAWAYTPLLVFSVVVGILGLLTSRTSPMPGAAVATVLCLVFLAGVLQAIPLPHKAAAAISPAGAATDYRRLYAAATMAQIEPEREGTAAASRTLSINPTRTAVGLVFLAAFGTLLVGCARGLGACTPYALTRGIVVLGLLVAFIGIVQRAIASEAVYGFWYPPPKDRIPFAPFINENHFAGWMVMAMSLAMGWFVACVASAERASKSDWRSRILWFSSPQASETILTGFAVGVMALSMVLTFSRGSFVCLVAAVLLSGYWLLQGRSSVSRRLVVAGYLLIVLVSAASWGGVEPVIRQFEGANLDYGGRMVIWQDALRIMRDFPLVGTGLNTFGIAMLRYQTLPRSELYIETHNDYLQIAAEGGLLLSVPVVIALVLLVREVRRRFKEGADDTRTYWIRAGAVTGLCAIAVQETVDFTLQMPGAAVLFVVLVAIAIHRPVHRTRVPA